MDSSTRAVCTKCGADLVRATEGLCSRCLMAQGLKIAFPTVTAGVVGTRSFGDYELIKEISRGGSGIVYRARQKSLDRMVAIKMLRFGPDSDLEMVKRFRSEATLAASLNHPNIVAIYEVGVHESEHYLAMDLVDGPSLAHFVKGEALPAPRAATYLKAVAEAIHYAHQRGILHRDLKPSNVLIDSNDQPRVTDFGLAKRMNVESILTLTGQVLGSPSYMPPEQAGGGQSKVGRQSDIYSLGAMLYHLLTGRPPFVGENLSTILEMVANSEPVSPRLLNGAVPLDLETICLKCLEKDQSRRYQTAQELADELNRFVRDEPIQARPVRPLERAWRWCRRKPALAGALAATLMLLLVVTMGAPVAILRINRAHNIARQNLYAADMRTVQQSIEAGDLGGARELLLYHLPAAGEADLRGFEWRYFNWRARGDDVATIETDAKGVRHLAVSSDGRLVAAGRQVWSVSSENFTPDQKLAEGDTALAFSPNGYVLLVSGKDGLKRRDLNTGDESFIAARETNVSVVAFSRTGKWLAVGNSEALKLFDARSWKLAATDASVRFELYFAAKALAFSPDEQTLVAAVGNPRPDGSELRCWDVPSLKPAPFPANDVKNAACIAFSPDGVQFFTGCWDGILRVWDAKTRTERPKRRSIQHHRSFVSDMAWLPGTDQLVTAGADRCIRIWGTELAERPVTLRGHTREVRAMTPATNRTIFSLSGDGVIKKWSARLAARGEFLSQGEPALVPVGMSADGRMAVTLADGMLKFWDVSQRELKGMLSHSWQTNRFKGIQVDPDRRQAVATVSPNLNWLALTLTNQPVQLGKVGDRGLDTLPISCGPIAFAIFSPDSKWLALPESTNSVALWDLTSGRQAASIPASVGVERHLSFSGGGQILAIQGKTNVLLWDLRVQRPAGEFNTRRDILSIALSSDGLLLATGSKDHNVRLYSCRTGHELRPPLLGHLSGVECLSFSPDGKTLVSASRQSVKLWNTATWREIAYFEQPGRVLMANFSGDGSTLVTSDGAGRFIQIWRAPFSKMEVGKKLPAGVPEWNEP